VSVGGNLSVAGNITVNSISVTGVVQYANLTTAQITAISPTLRGMTVFNYTTGNIQVYNGSKWANITLS
jgi:cytoskeletal protein CcmA (bactofilin family)